MISVTLAGTSGPALPPQPAQPSASAAAHSPHSSDLICFFIGFLPPGAARQAHLPVSSLHPVYHTIIFRWRKQKRAKNHGNRLLQLDPERREKGPDRPEKPAFGQHKGPSPAFGDGPLLYDNPAFWEKRISPSVPAVHRPASRYRRLWG